MRMIYLALVMFGLVLVLGLGAAHSDGPGERHVADAATVLTLPGAFAQAPKIMSPIRSDAAPLPFCGQCTQDSDCGTGHKCCGPSSCLECFEVVTCP